MDLNLNQGLRSGDSGCNSQPRVSLSSAPKIKMLPKRRGGDLFSTLENNEVHTRACAARGKNRSRFTKNIQTLNTKNKLKNLLKNIAEGDMLEKGGSGKVYKLDGNEDYAVKVFEIKKDEVDDKKAEEEFKKAKKLIKVVSNYVSDYNFAGAQALENVAIPILLKKGVNLDGNNIRKLVMPRVNGKDGSDYLQSSAGIYNEKVKNSSYFTTTNNKKIALSIALQKAMILRALNEAGYANIDTKIENIMISEHGDKNVGKVCKVWMIDVGSIVKHGNKISTYTSGTRAPEVDFGRKAGPEADVFSDAVERPLLLFGTIALKFAIPEDPAKFFSDFESAKRRKVEVRKNEYTRLGFKRPKLPNYFTNAQKMRYMYYHLGFLKIQKETGEIYPPEVLDSLAKLQALSTEPNPNIRIDEEIVERVLLNLMLSIDQWKEHGVYRIEGEKITPGSMIDEILPKNKSVNNENIQQNNKNHRNRMQNEAKDEEPKIQSKNQRSSNETKKRESLVNKANDKSTEKNQNLNNAQLSYGEQAALVVEGVMKLLENDKNKQAKQKPDVDYVNTASGKCMNNTKIVYLP